MEKEIERRKKEREEEEKRKKEEEERRKKVTGPIKALPPFPKPISAGTAEKFVAEQKDMIRYVRSIQMKLLRTGKLRDALAFLIPSKQYWVCRTTTWGLYSMSGTGAKNTILSAPHEYVLIGERK